MKKQFKRLFALMLTLCMLTGIIPSGFSFASAADKTITGLQLTPNRTLIKECSADGYWATYTDELGDHEFFYYWLSYSDFSAVVTYSDGSSRTYDNAENFCDETETFPALYAEQSYDKPWTVGRNTFTVEYKGIYSETYMDVIENPVESISVTANTTLMENEDGWDCTDYDDNDNPHDYFRYYSDSSYNYSLTVNYKDGTAKTYEHADDAVYQDTGYYLYIRDDQGYENPWGAGVHEVEAEFMGHKTTAQIEIVGSPIKSLTVIPTKPLIENGDGWWNTDYDANDQPIKYFFYWTNSYLKIILTYQDDTTKTYDSAYELEEDTGYWLQTQDDQSASNPWGVGKHEVTYRYRGAKTTVELEVVESPVKSLSITPNKQLIENANGFIDTDYETGEEFFRYEYFDCLSATVTMKNGEVKSYDQIWQLNEESDAYVTFTDDQSASTPWGVGKHKVTARYMGATAEAEIEITESPIKSISLTQKNPRYEFTDGWWYTDEETGKRWFIYDLYSYFFTTTVTMKNGDVKVYNYDWEIEEDLGYELNIGSNQFEDPLKVGKNKVTAQLMGVTAEAEIEITESPVKSISATPKKKWVEGLDGLIDEDNNGQEFFRYNIWDEDFTVTVNFKDGTTKTYEHGMWEEFNGQSLRITTDQYESPLKIGKNTVTAEFLGATAEVEIEIITNPVKSFSVKPRWKWYKDVDGWEDDNSGKFIYFIPEDAFITTVNYKDGTSKTYTGMELFQQTGFELGTANDDQYYTPWGVGKHKTTVRYMGCIAETEIEIIENPVKSVSVTANKKFIENKDGFTDSTTGNFIYQLYEDPIFDVTVSYKDGTSLTCNNFELYDKTGHSLDIVHDQFQNPWGVGKHEIEYIYAGAKYKGEVEVVKSDAHEHHYTESVTKQPTCTANGVKTFTCSGCGDSYTEAIPKLAHTKAVTGKKAATYFANGYTGNTVCKICGTVLSKGKTIAKKVLKAPSMTAKAGKKKLTVTVNKVTGATGYQIRYKTGSGKWVVKTYASKKKITKILKKLKSKKKYKIQARAMVKSGSKKAYSAWSKAKNIKVK